MILRILDSDGERLELRISDADWHEQLGYLEADLEANPEWFGEAWRPPAPGAARPLPDVAEVDQAVELLRLLEAEDAVEVLRVLNALRLEDVAAG